jgi:hypothetical protein
MQTRERMIQAQQQAEIDKAVLPAQVRAQGDVEVQKLKNLVEQGKITSEEGIKMEERKQALEVLKREGKDVTSPEYRDVQARVLQDKITLSVAEGDVQTALANVKALNDALLEQQKQGEAMVVDDVAGGQRLETPPVAAVPEELAMDLNRDGRLSPQEREYNNLSRIIQNAANIKPPLTPVELDMRKKRLSELKAEMGL